MPSSVRLAVPLVLLLFGCAAPVTADGAIGWLATTQHGIGLDPALEGSPGGVFAFAWVAADGTVKARVRSPAGVLGPVESVPVTPAPTAQNLKLDLAVDTRGAVHLSSALSNGRPLEYQQRLPGGTWLAGPEQVSAAKVRDAEIAAGPDGRAVVVYERDDEANDANDDVLLRSRSAAGLWSGEQNLTGGSDTGGQPQVEVDADGDAVLAYTRHPGATLSDSIPSAARVSVGGVLTTKSLDTQSGSLDLDLALDGRGDARFVWRGSDLETNTWPAGADPDAEGAAFAGPGAQDPDVTLDGTGGARFAWSEIPLGSANLAIHTRAQSLGGPLGTAGPLVVAADPLSAPRIAVNETGGGAVIWQRSGGLQAIEGLALPAGGPAGAVQPLSTTGSAGVSDHDLVVDRAGNAFAMWRRDGVIETAAFDAVGPSVSRPVMPARAERAVRFTFTVAATDNWGSPTPAWTFGDGTTADGTSVTHAWGSPGTYDVAVRVTDQAGYSASASGTRQVTVTDSRAPRVRRARMLRKRFRVGTPRPVSSRVRRGSAFIFSLSERASVRIALARRDGRRFVRAGALRRSAARGRNVIPFNGRIKRRALKRGVYRASLVATDRYSNPSRAVRLRFRIVR